MYRVRFINAQHINSRRKSSIPIAQHPRDVVPKSYVRMKRLTPETKKLKQQNTKLVPEKMQR
jgi:hypothetical protein